MKVQFWRLRFGIELAMGPGLALAMAEIDVVLGYKLWQFVSGLCGSFDYYGNYI